MAGSLLHLFLESPRLRAAGPDASQVHTTAPELRLRLAPLLDVSQNRVWVWGQRAMLLSQPVLLTCPPPPLALRLLPLEKPGIQASYQLSLLSPQSQTLRAKQCFTDDCEGRPTWRDSKLWEEFPVYFSIFQSAEHVTINSTGVNIRGHQILSQAPGNKL